MLIISDLHLEPGREDITRTLIDFLRVRASQSDSLYILGDLFEYWIGDDQPNPLADEVAAELKKLSDNGIAIYLMHGNRDFLMGEQFAERCGATLIEEPYLITVGSRRIALLHGDILCTDDIEYMNFRQMVRNQQWQQQFLAMPIAQRLQFAEQARVQSQEDTSNKAAEIMDVTESEVSKTLIELGVSTLIHGHTHRPATHAVKLEQPVNDSHDGTRVVLGDWDSQGWYIEVTGSETKLQSFPLLQS